MAHPLLERAAEHLAQARAINDEFEGKSMPAEAGVQMKAHLAKASEYRDRVSTEAQLKAHEDWISEPQYKHDMTASGSSVATEFGHGTGLLSSEKKELQRKAFFGYLRGGLDSLAPEEKAALVENATGQNLVPQDYAGTILKELPNKGVIRGRAFVRPTSKNKVDIGSVVINTAGWGKLETGATAEDGLGDPPAGKEQVTVHNLNALVKLGEDELADTDDNVESIIRSALVLKFAELEDNAFAAGTGDGALQPYGVATRARAGAAPGGVITQGLAAAVGETLVGDDVIRLQYAVPQWALTGEAAYYGGVSVAQAASLLKNADGDYIWRESMRAGEPATLAGYAFHRVDGLPAMNATEDGSAAAGTNPALIFGDMRQGYMVADRQQVRVKRLVELYAEDGQVGLMFTLRVGGDVIRPKAFARLLL